MSTLIVVLPPEPANPAAEYEFVLDTDGAGNATHGRCPPALLPTPGKPGHEVVVLVPARALNWLRVDLPRALKRAGPQRLRAALAGLLEDQLLDETDELHFAVFPGEPADGPSWVAACNRAWLHAGLHALEAAGLRIARIAPEHPPAQPQERLASVNPGAAPAELVLCTGEGVTALPLGPASIRLALRGDVQLLAEPCVASITERAFERTPVLQTDVERRLAAARASNWNLAQFDLTPSRQTRWRKLLVQAGHDLARGPAWRAARWSLFALLVLQVMGLNALAWKQRSDLEQDRAAVRRILSETFAHVSVVVDAPAQMEREVALLRQASGHSGGRGLTDALMQIALIAPHYQPLDGIHLDANELVLRGPTLAHEELDAIAGRLNALGWSASRHEQGLRLRLGDLP